MVGYDSDHIEIKNELVVSVALLENQHHLGCVLVWVDLFENSAVCLRHGSGHREKIVLGTITLLSSSNTSENFTLAHTRTENKNL